MVKMVGGEGLKNFIALLHFIDKLFCVCTDELCKIRPGTDSFDLISTLS